MPERFHLGHLGEEAVTAQVEAPAVLEHGAADPADDVVRLEHEGVRSLFGEQVGGGEATGARARDDHRFALCCSHDRARLADPLIALWEPPGLLGVAGPPAPRAGNQGTEMLRKANRE